MVSYTSNCSPSMSERSSYKHFGIVSLSNPLREPLYNVGTIHRNSNCDRKLADFCGFSMLDIFGLCILFYAIEPSGAKVCYNLPVCYVFFYG